jgi:diguanylate cyclase (GGDEF)-like protein
MLSAGYDTENALFTGLFDAMPFGIYVADVKTYEIIFANKIMRQRIGDVGNAMCYQVIYSKDSPCVECPKSRLVDESGMPTGKIEVAELFNDVDDQWYRLEDKCISWPDGRVGKYSISVNITQQKEVQNLLAEAHAELALKAKALEKLSATDPLTQLFNRMKMNQIIEAEMSRSIRYESPLSLIIIDLDKFKQVNDVYGHLVGDQVLELSAKILRATVRQSDSVARWGGEEFMVLCPESDLEAACQVAEKLRVAIENTVFPVVGNVTGSFGVASFSRHESMNSVIEKADQALYRAKHEGRNQVAF